VSSQIKNDLDLLSELEKGGTVSQLALSKKVGIAVGLLNAVMRRAVKKGYVKVSTAPAKRYAYYLTPRGFSEKARLVSEYLHDSLGAFRQARLEYIELFERTKLVPGSRIVLVGGGDFAEIALMSAEQCGVKFMGVVAPLGDVRVTFGLPLEKSIESFADAEFAVVACMRNPQAEYDKLVKRLGASRVLAPPMLRISRRPQDAE
jgi:DNA-binding MarR family transcriptional regulator